MHYLVKYLCTVLVISTPAIIWIKKQLITKYQEWNHITSEGINFHGGFLSLNRFVAHITDRTSTNFYGVFGATKVATFLASSPYGKPTGKQCLISFKWHFEAFGACNRCIKRLWVNLNYHKRFPVIFSFPFSEWTCCFFCLVEENKMRWFIIT